MMCERDSKKKMNLCEETENKINSKNVGIKKVGYKKTQAGIMCLLCVARGGRNILKDEKNVGRAI